jgi:hypothetical protein
MGNNQASVLDRFAVSPKETKSQGPVGKRAPKPKASNGKVVVVRSKSGRSAATPSRNGKNGQFVAKAKAKVAAPAKPERVITDAVPTVEGFALQLVDLGYGGPKGTGKRVKATVDSGEASPHAIRFLIYTDSEAEMAVALTMLGIEEAAGSEAA